MTHAVDTAKAAAPGELQLVPIRNADPNKVQTVVSLIRAAQNTKDGNVTAAVQAGAGRRGNDWNGQMLTKVFQQENGQPLQPNPATAPPAAAQPGAPAAAQPGAPVGVGDELGVDDDGTGGLLGPVQIEFLEGLDIIIIRGRKRDVERVQRIIAEIEEKSKETQPIVEVHHLKHIDNEAAVTLVTELYDEILSARQGQVSIRALVEPNAILLIGRKESVEEVIKLIEKLDQPDTGDFTIIRLKNISALDAEVTVRGFFVTRPGQDDNPRLGLGTQVKIIADYRTNSLIVQASPRDLGEIRRLVESIDADGGETETSMEIKVFRLKNALALDLADALLGAIRGEIGTTGQQGQGQQQPGGGGAATETQAQVRRPAGALEFKVVDQENGRLLRSGIMDDVQVTADPNINALLVRAPAESMELIAALIEELDQLPDMEALIKVFTVVNSDATNLAGMLQSLFGQQVTAGQGNAQGIFGFQQQTQAVQTAGEGSLVPLTFAVDIRTNSIIASGSS
ncbi:MAG: secretin N-terminal domain-containing protein, partial [Pirellulaceae bacterium]|nr:secretin N-terminal domain-containing protein [Pirellulaceae bacterium]